MEDSRYRKIHIRAAVILLSLIMALSMMPAFAYAEEEASEEPASEAVDVTGDESYMGDETSEDEGLELIRTDVDIADQDTLLEQYLENQAGVDIPDNGSGKAAGSESPVKKKALNATRRSKLSESEQKLFDGIRTGVANIADGYSSSAKLYIPMTAEEYSSCDFSLVVNSMLADLAYELYWYDKTEGVLRGYSGGNAVIYFSVANAYRSSASPELIPVGYSDYFYLYSVDTYKTGAASSAVSKARSIVSKYTGYSDAKRVRKYRDEICSLTDYNDEAAYTSGYPYGDPWQLIYVFDGDPSTTVVCEGYSKAFQLLCDLSDFDTIQSHIVTGGLNDSYYSNHMWNILQMDDGSNYIADLTNDDEGGGVFLTGCSYGSVDSGYVFNSLEYYYDAETKGGYDNYGYYHSPLYTTAELTLSASAYSESNPKIVHHKAVPETCYEDGNTEYWSKQGRLYSDVNCSVEIVKEDTVIPAGHKWSDWYESRAATCIDEGIEARTCSVCGDTQTRSTPLSGHDWSPWETTVQPTYSDTGISTRVCFNCGETEELTIGKLFPESIENAVVSNIKTRTYTGKAISQTPVVKVNGITLTYGTDYTITYKNNRSVGKASMVIKGKGGYSGSVSRSFKIRPKSASIRKPSAARKAVKVKWKKQSAKMAKSRITGYQVQTAANKKFTKSKKMVTVKGYKKTGKKIKGLKAHKKYYVRVRTYKTVKGKRYYSKWSKVKSVTTK